MTTTTSPTNTCTTSANGSLARATSSSIQNGIFRCGDDPQDIENVKIVLNNLRTVANRLSFETAPARYGAEVSAAIATLNAQLKVHGPLVEQLHKDELDEFQAVLSNACGDGALNLVARLHLLEIIELRYMRWELDDDVANYYKSKLRQVEQCRGGSSSTKELNANAPNFKPMSASNYLSSATVSLSSLLSVGSKASVEAEKVDADAPVVVDGGGGGDNNNVPSFVSKMPSPLPPPQTYEDTVRVGRDGDVIRISGDAEEIVKLAKSVLDDYFSKREDASAAAAAATTTTGSETRDEAGGNGFTVYDRRSLFSYSNSAWCRVAPTTWTDQWKTLSPLLARNVNKAADGGDDYFKPTVEHFMHERPLFPADFIIQFPPPSSHRRHHAVAGHEDGGGGLSHLDKLFLNRNDVGGGGGDAARIANSHKNENFICGIKYWDETRYEWVADSSEVRL